MTPNSCSLCDYDVQCDIQYAWCSICCSICVRRGSTEVLPGPTHVMFNMCSTLFFPRFYPVLRSICDVRYEVFNMWCPICVLLGSFRGSTRSYNTCTDSFCTRSIRRFKLQCIENSSVSDSPCYIFKLPCYSKMESQTIKNIVKMVNSYALCCAYKLQMHCVVYHWICHFM